MTAVYDLLIPPGLDDTFYIELAGEEARSILVVGCGTGRLACDLAARGHLVTAADPLNTNGMYWASDCTLTIVSEPCGS